MWLAGTVAQGERPPRPRREDEEQQELEDLELLEQRHVNEESGRIEDDPEEEEDCEDCENNLGIIRREMQASPMPRLCQPPKQKIEEHELTQAPLRY